MKKKLIILILFGSLFNPIYGCSSGLWYEGLREMERTRCNQLEDPTERLECMDEIDEMSYDRYRQEREISSATKNRLMMNDRKFRNASSNAPRGRASYILLLFRNAFIRSF